MNSYSRNATSAPWFFPARKKCSAAFPEAQPASGGKYMQYLAIPVLSKRNEIIGLIEIAVKKNPFISPVTMLEAHELADVKSWLYHLKDHFLLFHEIERAVRDGFP